MTYFILEPEVAGGCDPLLEALSNFIVTDHLKERLIETHASGVAFGDVEITKSGLYLDLYGDRPLPPSPGCKSLVEPEGTILVFHRLAAWSYPSG